jgi:flavodoxin
MFSIFFFSGTGNTFYTARLLAADLSAKGAEVELINIEKAGTAAAGRGRMILMFPVYAYGPPKIVQLRITCGEYICKDCMPAGRKRI